MSSLIASITSELSDIPGPSQISSAVAGEVSSALHSVTGGLPGASGASSAHVIFDSVTSKVIGGLTSHVGEATGTGSSSAGTKVNVASGSMLGLGVALVGALAGAAIVL